MGRSDTYEYDESDLSWFEQFDLRPATPDDIRERAAEARLTTLDIPTHLGRKMVTECDASLAFYRLTQLFGTPNVPGRTAGATTTERGVTTWQYLFDVTFDGEANHREFLLSVYDYKTDVSTGLSAWDASGTGVADPGETAAVSDLPGEAFLEGIVQLVLNMVEEPVPATYEELWV